LFEQFVANLYSGWIVRKAVDLHYTLGAVPGNYLEHFVSEQRLVQVIRHRELLANAAYGSVIGVG
jgi:hypothetical protein